MDLLHGRSPAERRHTNMVLKLLPLAGSQRHARAWALARSHLRHVKGSPNSRRPSSLSSFAAVTVNSSTVCPVVRLQWHAYHGFSSRRLLVVNYTSASVVQKDGEGISIIKSHAMRVVHRQRHEHPSTQRFVSPKEAPGSELTSQSRFCRYTRAAKRPITLTARKRKSRCCLSISQLPPETLAQTFRQPSSLGGYQT